MKISSVEETLIELKKGKMIIVMDHEDRENEGDLIMAAEFVTPEDINFMVSFGKGLLCAPLTAKRAIELDLPLVTKPHKNSTVHTTPFTIGVDLIEGCTTGISCFDRAKTMVALGNPNSKAQDFARPGHIFPLIAKDHGVLERPGHTEASVDLCKLAGLTPCALICEIIDLDGSMMRGEKIEKFAHQHQLKITTIDKIIEYRKNHDTEFLDYNFKLENSTLPTEVHHNSQITSFKDIHGLEHAVWSVVEKTNLRPMVRIHSECLTGDVFGSLRCDCGEQLKKSQQLISQHGHGHILYLRQEGRGIGLVEKIKAYQLQDQGLDTEESNIELGHSADPRTYDVAIKILKQLNVLECDLISNNPLKLNDLKTHGINVHHQIHLKSTLNIFNQKYLYTKIEKFGHIINFQEGHYENQKH